MEFKTDTDRGKNKMPNYFNLQKLFQPRAGLVLVYDTSFAHIASMTHSWELSAEFQWDFGKGNVENKLTTLSWHMYL